MGVITLKTVDADIIKARQTHFKATGLRAEQVALALGSRILYEAAGDCQLIAIQDGKRLKVHVSKFLPKIAFETADNLTQHTLTYGEGIADWELNVAQGIASVLECNMNEAVVALMLLQAHSKEFDWELLIQA